MKSRGWNEGQAEELPPPPFASSFTSGYLICVVQLLNQPPDYSWKNPLTHNTFTFYNHVPQHIPFVATASLKGHLPLYTYCPFVENLHCNLCSTAHQTVLARFVELGKTDQAVNSSTGFQDYERILEPCTA